MFQGLPSCSGMESDRLIDEDVVELSKYLEASGSRKPLPRTSSSFNMTKQRVKQERERREEKRVCTTLVLSFESSCPPTDEAHNIHSSPPPLHHLLCNITPSSTYICTLLVVAYVISMYLSYCLQIQLQLGHVMSILQQQRRTIVIMSRVVAIRKAYNGDMHACHMQKGYVE